MELQGLNSNSLTTAVQVVDTNLMLSLSCLCLPAADVVLGKLSI